MAFLYALLGVKEVFAPVMGEGAIYTLARHGINPICSATTAHIFDRVGSGTCPMEEAVAEIKEPMAALAVIREHLQELSMTIEIRQNRCAM